MNMDLGPIYEPDGLRFTMETWGWYLLGIGVLLVSIFLFFRWLQLYRKHRYRRVAFKRITRIEEDYQSQTVLDALVETLATLKLVAMETYGRQVVADLYGDSWLEFLESTGKSTPFTSYKKPIESMLYAANSLEPKEARHLIELSKKWISTHA